MCSKTYLLYIPKLCPQLKAVIKSYFNWTRHLMPKPNWMKVRLNSHLEPLSTSSKSNTYQPDLNLWLKANPKKKLTISSFLTSFESILPLRTMPGHNSEWQYNYERWWWVVFINVLFYDGAIVNCIAWNLPSILARKTEQNLLFNILQ